VPPGASASAAFCQLLSGSSQWNADAENTAWKAPGGSAVSSNRAFTNSTRPRPTRFVSANESRSLPGSTAVTWRPRATRSRVS
jgi:hypothetical protein